MPADAEILHGVCNPIRHAMCVESRPQTTGLVPGYRLDNPRMMFGWCVENFSFDSIQAFAVGSHPKIPFAVHARGKHKGRRQSLLRRDALIFSIRVIPKNALAQCADNQIAFLVFTGGGDGCIAPRIWSQILFELSGIPFLDPSVHQPPRAAALPGENKIEPARLEGLVNDEGRRMKIGRAK